MKVEQLIEEGLISGDIADVIFSTDALLRKDRLDDTALIPTAYRVCSVYLSLLHAYVVGEAIYQGTTVDKLPYKHISKWILDFWDTSSVCDFNEMSVLSALINSARGDSVPKFFGESAVKSLGRVRDVYGEYIDQKLDKKIDLKGFSVDEFKALLGALPLLHTTRIDSGKFELSFATDDGTRFSIKCYPFIGYWDEGNARTITKDTPEQEDEEPYPCCVLVGVRDGGNSSTVRAEIAIMDDIRDEETRRMKTKLVQYSSNNEYVRMICNAVKHPIEWVSVDDSICDLAFLKTLASTISGALVEFWDSNQDFMNIGTVSLAGSLKKMFEGSQALYDAIDLNSSIEETDLINTFYGLFIQHGIFKTMFALFLDSADTEYGDEFFEIYVRHMDNLTEESRAAFKSECEKNIERHLCKLKTIIPESSPVAFASRTRAIKAEWRAQCALKAAGLQADNLFAEQEEIRSIDNFYYMIKNSSTQLMDDLKNVLVMLISLYRSILSASIPFQKAQFHADMWNVKTKINNLSIIDLLEELKKTVLDSENNEKLDYYLGRSRICDYHKLESFIRPFRKLIPKTQQNTDTSAPQEPQVFISYAHVDIDRVKMFTEHFKQSNIPIYMDDTQFHTGDNWYEVAQEYIYSPHCKAVVVFLSNNSVQSEAVKLEIGAAVEAAKTKFGDAINKSRFIIPVNLETEAVETYLHDKIHRKKDTPEGFSSDTWEFANFIAKKISTFNIYNRAADFNIDKLERDIKDRLNVRFDGSLDESQRPYNSLEYAVATLYSFLKFGDDFKGSTQKNIDHNFKSLPVNGKTCIFPLVTSVKETQIKRDNITLMGYEIVGNKEVSEKTINYILSSRRLPPDDYYCLPNSRTTAKDCAWMVDPLLINHKLFIKPPTEG